MNRKVFFVVLLLLATMGASAQKISGDITPLKDQKEVNVVLDFTGTLVNGQAEDKFIADQTKGKSDADKNEWLSDWREKLPSEALSMLTGEFNRRMSDKFFSLGEYKNAEYTIIIKVIDITTGSFGPFSKAAAVNANVSFVKTGDTASFATVTFKNSRSLVKTLIPVLIERIAMSFSSLGGDLAGSVSDTLK